MNVRSPRLIPMPSDLRPSSGVMMTVHRHLPQSQLLQYQLVAIALYALEHRCHCAIRIVECHTHSEYPPFSLQLRAVCLFVGAVVNCLA